MENEAGNGLKNSEYISAMDSKGIGHGYGFALCR
jgi:hypothetical protein